MNILYAKKISVHRKTRDIEMFYEKEVLSDIIEKFSVEILRF